MNKSTEILQSMIITKESLRPTCKRTRTRSRSGCNTPQLIKDELKEFEAVPLQTDSKIKCRRQWEQWGEDDQEIFFQGLAEYGKDYGKIKLMMKKKLKSKSEDEMKTKEQIRHFYHRTWTKISKTLKLQHEPDPKKAYRREMHYMLCLGEIRKKGIQGLGQKVLSQLNELVTKGSTYLRYRGKNVRVRPPNRYLKKLYKEVNSITNLNLPKHVHIEFLPNTNTAFNYVQKHAFNPRLRFTTVSINAKLSEVFDMINKRFTDFYTDNSLSLRIYPLHMELSNPHQFAEKLADAEELLLNCFQKQEMPIVLENTTKPSPAVLTLPEEAEQKSQFPSIFGKITEKERVVSPFAGYWTRSTAEDVCIRTLYVALGQNESLRFKYEWKDSDKKSSFSNHALEYLLNLCREEIQPKEKLSQKYIAPKLQDSNLINVFQDAVHNNTSLIKTNPLTIPHPPRPGRTKRNYLNSQLRNRVIAPRVTTCNSTILTNAVAVNLIPHSQGYSCYDSVPSESTKLRTVTNNISPLPNTYVSMNLPSNMPAESFESFEEEVIDQGYTKGFQALNNLLASATTLVSETNSPTTPQPVQSNVSMEISPVQFAWLDETQELTMNTFLDVCQMQELQEKQQELRNTLVPESVFSRPAEESLTSTDPALPIYHSGDTSHGPFELKFEGSNPEKSKEIFGYT